MIIVYNGDRKNHSDINYNNDNIIDKEKFRIILKNYFNDKYHNTLTEVKEYYNIHFSEYLSLINEPNFLKNQFYPWKRNCILFKFYSVFENNKTKNDKIFLRNVIYNDNIEDQGNNYNISIIYASDFHLRRAAESNNLFIDSTFIHPPEFIQLLVIMYLDIIGFIYIPGVYTIMNSKNEKIYEEILLKIKYLISCNDKFSIKAKTITTDYELALINSVSKVFEIKTHHIIS